jgi:3-phosphoshikimate 1-carboxyvinyltransferase
MAAASIVPESDVVIRNVGCNSTRNGIVEILRRMGASIEVMNQRAEAGEAVADFRVRTARLKGIDVGPEFVARTIDEYPILAAVAAVADGVTTFYDVKELRYKESDRIAAMAEGLRRLGVSVDEREDRMTVHGGTPLRGGSIRSFGDHRIAMSFAIAGLVSPEGLEIDDAECVGISFPGFFGLLEQIRLH